MRGIVSEEEAYEYTDEETGQKRYAHKECIENKVETRPLNAANADSKNKLKNKNLLIILGIILVFIAGVGFTSWRLYSQKQYEQEYKIKLVEIKNLISSSSTEALIMCHEYSQIWRDAITGGIDFNTMIGIQHTSFKLEGKVDEVKNNKGIIDNKMKDLTDAPERFVRTYEKLIEMYGVYSEIQLLAQYPSGSLVEYNQKINHLETQLIRLNDEINVTMPK